MAVYSKETLEKIRDRVDLVDLISGHVPLKKAGATYKGLCPFHDEKSPSFVVQNQDRHYHCFGCGAHGDALQFLMTFLRYSFSEAVEYLAEKYGIILEKADEQDLSGPSKKEMKRALELASALFSFHLLNTPEGESALKYLSSRGIDRPFIERFEVGYAPKEAILKKWLEQENISFDIAKSAGLFSSSGRAYFSERVTFPIHSLQGTLIGFSARKIREETFGGKYINTPETLLFKKSKILFGGYHSRKRMAKEQKVITVEGQIDALRLIYEGFDFTIATQGTAFGADHVREFKQLGIKKVFLTFDADPAGQAATRKAGNLLMREGIEVFVVSLPEKEDPDSFLRSAGKAAFQSMLDASSDFLSFLVEYEKIGLQVETPHGKNEWVKRIIESITSWNQPLIEHESLQRVAQMTQAPLELLGKTALPPPPSFVRKSSFLNPFEIDHEMILEKEFLFWWLQGDQSALKEKVKAFVSSDDFVTPLSKNAFIFLQSMKDKPLFEALIECPEPALQEFFTELTEMKVDRSKAKALAEASFQKFLDRNWLKKREEIKKKMCEKALSDEEAISLASQFSLLKRVEVKTLS